MKKLYMIGGTMGVGKTAVSQALKKLLDRAVFLDGDWCWDADPFVVNDETKEMVVRNICFLLNSFLRCGAYENVVFCWVMHEQGIRDGILSRLDLTGCEVKAVSLVCSQRALRARLEKDIAAGIRQPDVTERSLRRLPLYELLDTVNVDTTDLTPEEAADLIAAM